MIHETRTTTVRSKRSPRAYIRGIYIPLIAIAGIWIEQAGFKKGDKCKIEVSRRKITIKMLDYGKAFGE